MTSVKTFAFRWEISSDLWVEYGARNGHRAFNLTSCGRGGDVYDQMARSTLPSVHALPDVSGRQTLFVKGIKPEKIGTQVYTYLRINANVSTGQDKNDEKDGELPICW